MRTLIERVYLEGEPNNLPKPGTYIVRLTNGLVIGEYAYSGSRTDKEVWLAVVEWYEQPTEAYCTCGSNNYGYGFAKCFDCGKVKEPEPLKVKKEI